MNQGDLKLICVTLNALGHTLCGAEQTSTSSGKRFYQLSFSVSGDFHTDIPILRTTCQKLTLVGVRFSDIIVKNYLLPEFAFDPLVTLVFIPL